MSIQSKQKDKKISITSDDIEYIPDHGSAMAVKDLPLNRFYRAEGTDGDAKYDIYIATEERFFFCQAWQNEDGTLRFDSENKNDGLGFSIIKDNILDIPLPDAHEGIGYFTLGFRNNIFEGTSVENDFRYHEIKNGNLYAVVKELVNKII